MPRPRRCRCVRGLPKVDYFKPAGMGLSQLDNVVLTVGEYEALRLKDLEGIDQKQAAEKMNISQPTFHRLVLTARKKVADAIVNGKSIKIQGGNYTMPDNDGTGPRQDRGRGRMGGFAAGPGGECVCSKCDYKEPQVRGQPCIQKKCPKCGSQMTRGE